MARYAKYTIRYGDTLQSIAQTQMGDVERWTEIMTYNSLRYPYIVSTDQEKLQDMEHLVTQGDQIIIPQEVNLMDTDVNKLDRRDQNYVMDLTLGRDLDMTSDPKYYNRYGTSDEVLALSGNYQGDIRTVQGVENLKQAIHARLLTRRGSLLLHPNYGSDLHKLFGKADDATLRLIDIEVCRVVQTDTRVASCTLVEATIEGDAYSGKFKVELRSLQESFDLLVQGDQRGQVVVGER